MPGESESAEVIDRLRLSLRGLKGHLTRAAKSAEKLCEFSVNQPSSTTTRQLEESLSSLQVAHEKVAGTLLELQQLDTEDGQFEQYEGAAALPTD